MWKLASGMTFGLVCGIGLCVVLWARPAPAQQGVPAVLRAQRFELVNAAGRVQASLSLHSDPELGKRLGLKGEFTFFTIERVTKAGDAAPAYMMLGAGEEGSLSLMMLNAKEQSYAGLGVPAKGAPKLILGSRGKEREFTP
jgi:hypothetical protein